MAYIEEKFTIDGFYMVNCDILRYPKLIKADSRQEAEDIFNEYWENDIDYMDCGREHIVGSWKANGNEIIEGLKDGYLIKRESNN